MEPKGNVKTTHVLGVWGEGERERERESPQVRAPSTPVEIPDVLSAVLVMAGRGTYIRNSSSYWRPSDQLWHHTYLGCSISQGCSIGLGILFKKSFYFPQSPNIVIMRKPVFCHRFNKFTNSR